MHQRVFKGIWTAALTPLGPDLSIDHSGLAEHSNWLLANGSHGVVIFGTTGEGNGFSVEERIDAMERLADSGVPPGRMIIGTGCCALPDTVALTTRANELGFSGILLLPPFYYKTISDAGLFDYVRRVIEGVGHPGLRILLYHFPRMAGLGWSLDLIRRLLDAFPGVIAGIKDSSGDGPFIQALCTTFPEMDVFAGSETYLRDALLSGGAGCVSATANVTSRLIRRVYDGMMVNEAAKGGKTALGDGFPGRSSGLESEHALMISYRKALEKYPFVPVLKQLLFGLLPDSKFRWQMVRPPLQPLNPDAAAQLLCDLADLPVLPNFAR